MRSIRTVPLVSSGMENTLLELFKNELSKLFGDQSYADGEGDGQDTLIGHFSRDISKDHCSHGTLKFF